MGEASGRGLPLDCKGCGQTLYDGHAVLCHALVRNEGKDCRDAHLSAPARVQSLEASS